MKSFQQFIFENQVPEEVVDQLIDQLTKDLFNVGKKFRKYLPPGIKLYKETEEFNGLVLSHIKGGQIELCSIENWDDNECYVYIPDIPIGVESFIDYDRKFTQIEKENINKLHKSLKDWLVAFGFIFFHDVNRSKLYTISFHNLYKKYKDDFDVQTSLF